MNLSSSGCRCRRDRREHGRDLGDEAQRIQRQRCAGSIHHDAVFYDAAVAVCVYLAILTLNGKMRPASRQCDVYAADRNDAGAEKDRTSARIRFRSGILYSCGD